MQASSDLRDEDNAGKIYFACRSAWFVLFLFIPIIRVVRWLIIIQIICDNVTNAVHGPHYDSTHCLVGVPYRLTYESTDV